MQELRQRLGSWEFHINTRIRFGWGLLSKLPGMLTCWGRKVLWIGYREPGGLEPVYEKLRPQFVAAGLEVEEFLEVGGEPNGQLVDRGAEAARGFGAEVVVGIGGGSVLDTAKAVAAVAQMGGRLEQYLSMPSSPGQVEQGVSKPVPQESIERALPVIAVPTTAGTGSEVTSLAVFHWANPEQPGMPMKLTLGAESLAPRLALVDPAVLASCPPEVLARCGADALAHAMEGALSRRTSRVVRVLAEEAIINIFSCLPVAFTQPTDRAIWEGLALAATLSGIVLEQAGATVAHAMAHALGALGGWAHGLCVAVCTPPALRYNWTEARPLLARWAQRLQLPGAGEEQLAEAFFAQLQHLWETLGLPSRVEMPGGSGADWATRLAQNAFQSTRIALKLNPRKVDEAAVGELFRQILH